MHEELEKELEMRQNHNPSLSFRLVTGHPDELKQATEQANQRIAQGEDFPTLTSLTSYQTLLYGSSFLHRPSVFVKQLRGLCVEQDQAAFLESLNVFLAKPIEIEPDHLKAIISAYIEYLERNPKYTNKALVDYIVEKYEQLSANSLIRQTCALELTRTIEFGDFAGRTDARKRYPYDDNAVITDYEQRFEQNPAARPYMAIITLLCNQHYLMKTADFGQFIDERPGHFLPGSQGSKRQIVVLPKQEGEGVYFLMFWPHFAYKTQSKRDQIYRMPLAGEQSVLWKIQLTKVIKESCTPTRLADFNGTLASELTRFELTCVHAYHDVYDPVFHLAGNNKLLARTYDYLLDDKPLSKDDYFSLYRLEDQFHFTGNDVKLEQQLWQYVLRLQDQSLDSKRDSELLASRQGQHLLLLAYTSERFARYLFTQDLLLQVKLLTLVCKAPRCVEMLDKISEKYHFDRRIVLAILQCRTCYLLHYDRTIYPAELGESRLSKITQYFIEPSLKQCASKFMTAVLLSISNADGAIENRVYASEYLNEKRIRDSIDHDTLQHLMLLSGAPNDLVFDMSAEHAWPSVLSVFSWGDSKPELCAQDVLTQSAFSIDTLWEKLAHHGLDEFCDAFDARPDNLKPIDKVERFLQRLVKLDDGLAYLRELRCRYSDTTHALGKLLQETERAFMLFSLGQEMTSVAFRQSFVQQIKDKQAGFLIALQSVSVGHESAMLLIDEMLQDEHVLDGIDLVTLNHMMDMAPEKVKPLVKNNQPLLKRWKLWCSDLNQRFSVRDQVEHLSVNPGLWEGYFSCYDGLWDKAKLLTGGSETHRGILTGDDLFRLLIISSSLNKPRHLNIILSDPMLRERLQNISAKKRLIVADALNIRINRHDAQTNFFFEGVHDAENKAHAQALISKSIAAEIRSTHGKKIVQLFCDTASLPSNKLGADDRRKIFARNLLCNEQKLAEVMSRLPERLTDAEREYLLMDFLNNPDPVRQKVFVRHVLSDVSLIQNLAHSSPDFALAILRVCVSLLLTEKTVFCSKEQLENIFCLLPSEALTKLFDDSQFSIWVADLLLTQDVFLHLFKKTGQQVVKAFVDHLSVQQSRLLYMKCAHYYLACEEEKSLESVLSDSAQVLIEYDVSVYQRPDNRTLLISLYNSLSKVQRFHFGSHTKDLDLSLEYALEQNEEKFGAVAQSGMQRLITLKLLLQGYNGAKSVMAQSDALTINCEALLALIREKPCLLTGFERLILHMPTTQGFIEKTASSETITASLSKAEALGDQVFCAQVVSFAQSAQYGAEFRQLLLNRPGMLDQFLSSPSLTTEHLRVVLNKYPDKTVLAESILLKAVVSRHFMQSLLTDRERLLLPLFRVEQVDLSLLCEFVLLLTGGEKNQADLLSILLARLESEPEKLFDPVMFYLINQYALRLEKQVYFYQWLFEQFVHGVFSGMSSNLVVPKIHYAIDRGWFVGDDFVTGIIKQLEGVEYTINFLDLIKKESVLKHVVCRLQSGASIDSLLRLTAELNLEEYPGLFESMYRSPTVDFIVQHATPEQLDLLLKYQPDLLELIAKYYVETSSVRIKVDWAHSMIADDSVLTKLMQASCLLPDIVSVSDVARSALYELTLFKRYVEVANNNQLIGLLMHDELQEKLDFSERRNELAEMIDYQHQAGFVNSIFRYAPIIERLLLGDTMPKRIMQLLPTLLRCHRQAVFSHDHSENTIYTMLGNYVFSDNKTDFSDRFQMHSYAASPKQFYAVFKEFQGMMGVIKDQRFPDAYARSFMACLFKPCTEQLNYKYKELIDRLLSYCSPAQLFLILEQDDGHALLSKRVVDHCLAHSAYVFPREKKRQEYQARLNAAKDQGENAPSHLIVSRIAAEIASAESMLGASLKKKLRQAQVFNVPAHQYIALILKNLFNKQYNLRNYRASLGLCRSTPSPYASADSEGHSVSLCSLMASLFDYDQVLRALESEVPVDEDECAHSILFDLPLDAHVLYWSGQVEQDPEGFVHELLMSANRLKARAFARSVCVVEKEESGKEQFVFSANKRLIKSQNYVDCYQYIYAYLFQNDSEFAQSEIAQFSLLLIDGDYRIEFAFHYKSNHQKLLPWHNRVINQTLEALLVEKQGLLLENYSLNNPLQGNDFVPVNRYDAFWFHIFEQEKDTLIPLLSPAKRDPEQHELICMAMKYFVVKDLDYCSEFFEKKISIKKSGDQPVFQTAEGFSMSQFPAREDVLRYALASGSKKVRSVAKSMAEQVGLSYELHATDSTGHDKAECSHRHTRKQSGDFSPGAQVNKDAEKGTFQEEPNGAKKTVTIGL